MTLMKDVVLKLCLWGSSARTDCSMHLFLHYCIQMMLKYY